MVKVTRPLFSNAAYGTFADIGTFRRGQHGPQLIKQTIVNDRKSESQLKMRACFKVAISEWSQLPPLTRGKWSVYWRQWLVDHPECKT
jgi:hypothetical protein